MEKNLVESIHFMPKMALQSTPEATWPTNYVTTVIIRYCVIILCSAFGNTIAVKLSLSLLFIMNSWLYWLRKVITIFVSYINHHNSS